MKAVITVELDEKCSAAYVEWFGHEGKSLKSTTYADEFTDSTRAEMVEFLASFTPLSREEVEAGIKVSATVSP